MTDERWHQDIATLRRAAEELVRNAAIFRNREPLVRLNGAQNRSTIRPRKFAKTRGSPALRSRSGSGRHARQRRSARRFAGKTPPHRHRARRFRIALRSHRQPQSREPRKLLRSVFVVIPRRQSGCGRTAHLNNRKRSERRAESGVDKVARVERRAGGDSRLPPIGRQCFTCA